MVPLAIAITFVLGILTITVLSNLVFTPRLLPAEPREYPFVSILIPARDEARLIGRIVHQFLSQTYPYFELIILDDASTDRTDFHAINAGLGDPRFHLLRGKPLPKGWLGKNWACHQLSQAARGDLLLFIDADIQV